MAEQYVPFTAIDHVQLAMPAGREDEARAFFCGVFGMTELPKPPELAKRGGCWFASGDVQVHVGVEAEFRPARKAHPGLRCAICECCSRVCAMPVSRSRKTTRPARLVLSCTIRSETGSNWSASA